jgi:hypothetical protein
MAKELIARRGKQSASSVGSATSKIENLAAAMGSLGAGHSVTESNGGPPQRALAPVEQWNPPFCGNIDMRIARDRTWFYYGTPINRPALVRLFSTILRKESDGYVLVTPVEKVGIKVEDAPFPAVEMIVAHRGADQVLRFLTNVGDWVEAGFNHPIRFEKAACDGSNPMFMCAAICGRLSPAPWFSISWNSAKSASMTARAVLASFRPAVSSQWRMPMRSRGRY